MYSSPGDTKNWDSTLPAHDLALQARSRPLSGILAGDGFHARQLAALLPVQEHLVLDVVPALQHLRYEKEEELVYSNIRYVQKMCTRWSNRNEYFAPIR